MSQLIPIHQTILSGGTHTQTASARDLYNALGIKKDFSNWIKAQIKRADLTENSDYSSLALKGEREIGATRSIDYLLSLDSAKHIAMMSQSKKAKEVRNYFISIEKKYMAELESRAVQNQLPQFPEKKQSNYFDEKFDLALALYAAYQGGAIDPGDELLSNPELLDAYNSYPIKRSNLQLNQISKLIREPLLKLKLISARKGQTYVANTDLSRAICDLGLLNMGVTIQAELSEYNRAVREGTVEAYIYQAPVLPNPTRKEKRQITIKVEHVTENDLSEELSMVIDAFSIPLNGLLSNHPTLTIVANIRLLTQELSLLNDELGCIDEIDNAVLALTALVEIAEDADSSHPINHQQMYSNLFFIIKNLERR